MRGGMFLVFLGVALLILALSVNVSFTRFVLWVIGIGFIVLGVEGMVSNGFPNGLVALGAGVLIILALLDVIRLGFWNFVLAMVGLSLIQFGIRHLMNKYW